MNADHKPQAGSGTLATMAEQTGGGDTEKSQPAASLEESAARCQFQPLRCEASRVMFPSPRLQKAGEFVTQDGRPPKSLFAARSLHEIERQRQSRQNKVAGAYGSTSRPASERAPAATKTPRGAKYLAHACLVPSSLPLQKNSSRKVVPLPAVEIAGSQVAKPWRIVEATSWLPVSHGDAQERLPPKSWVVLDESSGSSEAIRNSSGKSAWRLLLGGGLVAAGEPEAFCEVPECRVTVAAAEANMQRASRGKSVLALRHAAKVLDLAGAGPQEVARAKRLENCVQRAAEMREQQHAEHAKRPASSQAPLCSKRGGLADFRRFCVTRFGNMVRAWHALDPEGLAALGQDAFHRATEAVGYQGASTNVWRELDVDGAGIVTILELDPRSARALARFKFWAQENLNPDMEAAYHELDRSRSRRISCDDFCVACTSGGLDPGDGVSMAELWSFLDREGLGAITADSFKFLKRWRAPPFLLAQPDSIALARIKQMLVVQNGGSSLRAWKSIQQKSLKVESPLHVGWRAWPSVCERLGVTDEATIWCSWRALDLGCTGRGSLREFDQASYEAANERLDDS